MALTLNQIVSRLKRLAESHHQINSFYFGDEPEFTTNGEVDYPACLLVQQPGGINRSQRLQTFNFRVYFLDLVGVSTETEGNETEVLSDMHSVAADFIAMLNYTGYQDDFEEVSNVSPVTPVEEEFADMVAGCYVEFSISTLFISDRCQVPADDVTFETDFDMARTKILTYTGTGSEGSAFEVAELAGKTVLAAYRAGNYKRIITTAPADFDKLRVVGTDLGDNKGILSSTGYVGLQTNDALVNGETLDFIIWSS